MTGGLGSQNSQDPPPPATPMSLPAAAYVLPWYCLNCTIFGKTILRKIIEIVATSCHLLKLKCTKFSAQNVLGSYNPLPQKAPEVDKKSEWTRRWVGSLHVQFKCSVTRTVQSISFADRWFRHSLPPFAPTLGRNASTPQYPVVKLPETELGLCLASSADQCTKLQQLCCGLFSNCPLAYTFDV